MLTPFHEWLSERMRVTGHDRTTLAADLGVSHQTVCDWLHAKYLPSSPKIRPLARVLQADEAEVRHRLVDARAAAAAPCQSVPSAPEVHP